MEEPTTTTTIEESPITEQMWDDLDAFCEARDALCRQVEHGRSRPLADDPIEETPRTAVIRKVGGSIQVNVRTACGLVAIAEARPQTDGTVTIIRGMDRHAGFDPGVAAKLIERKFESVE